MQAEPGGAVSGNSHIFELTLLINTRHVHGHNLVACEVTRLPHKIGSVRNTATRCALLDVSKAVSSNTVVLGDKMFPQTSLVRIVCCSCESWFAHFSAAAYFFASADDWRNNNEFPIWSIWPSTCPSRMSATNNASTSASVMLSSEAMNAIDMRVYGVMT